MSVGRPARLAAALAALAALPAPALAQEALAQEAALQEAVPQETAPTESRADRPSKARRMADRIADTTLSLSVRLALAADARTRPLDLAVTARGGVVQLVGPVPEPDRPVVAAVVFGVPGVYAVRRLERLPPPPAPPRWPDGAAPSGDGRGGAAEVLPVPGPTFHAVERGDTLFLIARRYGTTVDALRRLNGLASTAILAGSRLRVR